MLCTVFHCLNKKKKTFWLKHTIISINLIFNKTMTTQRRTENGEHEEKNGMTMKTKKSSNFPLKPQKQKPQKRDFYPISAGFSAVNFVIQHSYGNRYFFVFFLSSNRNRADKRQQRSKLNDKNAPKLDIFQMEIAYWPIYRY